MLFALVKCKNNIRITLTNKMRFFLLVYFNSKPLHVSSRLAAHHQEVLLCTNSNWYSHALCWLAASRILPAASQYNAWHIPIAVDRVDPPDDEQQTCSKHVEAYYWNKLIENSTSCWVMLPRYMAVHGQQNIKFVKRITWYFLVWFCYPTFTVEMSGKPSRISQEPG